MTNKSGLEFETEKLLPDMSRAWDRDKDRVVSLGRLDDAYELGFRAGRATSQPIDVWLPIETAPMDGTVIWGFWKHGTVSWQRPVMYIIDFEGDGKWVTDEYRDINTIPTHWMPLPKPPEGR